MPTHDVRMKCERSLRHGGDTQCLRGKHEIADIAPAIDGPVDAKRLVGMNDGY
jgi:hypothetical protein